MNTIQKEYRHRNNRFRMKSSAIKNARDFVHASGININEDIEEITSVLTENGVVVEWYISDVISVRV